MADKKQVTTWIEKTDSAASEDNVLPVNAMNVELGDRRLTADQAVTGAIAEKDLSIAQSVRDYWKGILWCLLVSTCVIMEGYDTILIGNFYAYPTFQKAYGTYRPELKEYQLDASWQAALSNAAGIGAFFGVLLNGILIARYGMKKVVIGALILLSALVFIVFFAPSIEVLFVGELLLGFPWGVFATTAPAYASECLPLNLRVYFTSWVNMCFVIGQLIAAGVLAALVGNDTEWGYRIPFAIQWVWPAFLIPLLLFAPESPFHLVRQGRLEEAEKSINRLVSSKSKLNTQEILANIVHTNRLEVEMEIGTSYWDCFKGTEKRRTEIACVAFAGQILSGSSFAYNASYFFEQVGLSSHITYQLNLGGTGLALFGCICSWILLMPYLGRRTMYIVGMATETVVLYLIGILNSRTSSNSVAMAQAVLTLVWTFIFQLSIGQLGWAIPAEVGSTRLRQKTICLARNSYYIVSVISQVLQPYFMNPTEWNLRGYTGFVWGSTALLMTIWAFFRLPETKNRHYDELDVLFAKRVSARKFKQTDVDAFDPEQTAEVAAAESSSRRGSLVAKIGEKLK